MLQESNGFVARCIVGVCLTIAAIIVVSVAGMAVRQYREEASYQAEMNEHAKKLRILDRAVVESTREAEESRALKKERKERHGAALASEEKRLKAEADIVQQQYLRGAIPLPERDRQMDRIDAKREKAQQEYDDAVWGKGKRP